MQQLPLQVGPSDQAVFGNFLAGPNAALVHTLEEIAGLRSRSMLWMWGPPQSGRSHLLQATVNAADSVGQRAAYLPLHPSAQLPLAAMEGMGDLDVICLDDADAIAGDPDWELALFRLFERLRQRGARLVAAAGKAPLHAGFRLQDLASRFSSGATFRVHPLADDDKILALQQRAQWRGFELPEDTALYLLSRLDRHMGSLFAVLDRLDREALAAQKRLTVPFVRSVLIAGDDAGTIAAD